MDGDRFITLLDAFSEVRIAVVGDFFLDKYLVIDPALTETSLETGLEAWQVASVRHSPGAAGTVMSNLAALQVGSLQAVGIIGDDGEGYDLRAGLQRNGVDMEHLMVAKEVVTPTYTKPLVINGEGNETEGNRIDIRNRRPFPQSMQAELVRHVEECLPEVDGLIIVDQVPEEHLGVITPQVRDKLAELAADAPEKVFFADSRGNIDRFRNIIIKPNNHEAAGFGTDGAVDENDISALSKLGREIARRNHRPVYITIGPEGMLACTADEATHVPGIRVQGAVDTVGAGDSATAGIVAALCAGANVVEAALLGNLVASITIQQLGTTGTASPGQVLQRFLDTVCEQA